MKDSTVKLLVLLIVLLVLGFLYNRYEKKRQRQTDGDMFDAIQNYLLDETDLDHSKKPILWIHVPHEYNARHWLSFGSRSSFELNQPYLYLTVRSIIHHCEKQFTICIIDDRSFARLLPRWCIDLSAVANPIQQNLRQLAQMKLLHRFGGVFCPISFLCMRSLFSMYEKGALQADTMFVCEKVNRTITSGEFEFYPSLEFCGAPKECPVVEDLIQYMEAIDSEDFTAASTFLGAFPRWVMKRVSEGKVQLIPGAEVGVKTVEDAPVLVDDLLANNYLHLYSNMYGIWIPAEEILGRRNFEWFARMSAKQVLHSNTILGNYFLITLGNISPHQIEPLQPMVRKDIEKEFVGFWKTPNYPGLYGLKPNFLGDHVPKVEYTGR